MAKTTTLVIKVTDQEFQKFVNDFSKLTKSMEDLNKKWTQLNTTTQRTLTQVNALNSALSNSVSMAKGLHTHFTSITRQLRNWGAIIGGVTAAIGFGAMFGIDRLANSIMQKRRQAMTLGDDYGRVQAAKVYGQTLFGGSTGATLENIKKGLMGDPEFQKPLVSAGVPFGSRKPPTEVLKELLPKIREDITKFGPGWELKVAQSMGYNKLFSDDTLMRLAGPHGKEEEEKFIKRSEENEKVLQLEKEAQEAWADLNIQFAAARATLETTFGRTLQKLAKPLGDVSDAFIKVIRTLMEMPIVEQAIKKMAEWLDDFAKFLEKDETKKMLEQWGKDLEKIKWKDLEEGMNTFIQILKTLTSIFGFLFRASGVPQAVEGANKGAKVAEQAGVSPGVGGLAGGLLGGLMGGGPMGIATQLGKSAIGKFFGGGGGQQAPAPGPGQQAPTGTMPQFDAERPPPPSTAPTGPAPTGPGSARPGATAPAPSPAPTPPSTTAIPGSAPTLPPSMTPGKAGPSGAGAGATGGTGGLETPGAPAAAGAPAAGTRPSLSFNRFSSWISGGGLTNRPTQLLNKFFGGNKGAPAGPGGTPAPGGAPGGAAAPAPLAPQNWLTTMQGGGAGVRGGWADSIKSAAPPATKLFPDDPRAFKMPPQEKQGLGPLSMDNWQGTKRPSLTIHNVPGSNIFMTTNGLAGGVGE